MASYGAALPRLIGPQPWGMTTETAGIVGSLALVGALIGAVVSGTLTDVFGRRRLFIGGLVLFSLAMILCGIAPNLEVFATGRFICGLGFGGVIPVSVSLAAEFAPRHYRARIIGLVLTGLGVGTALAAFVALWSLDSHGFRPVFLIGGFPLLITVPLAIAFVREPASSPSRGRTGRASSAAAGTVRRLLSPPMRWATLTLWVVAPLQLVNLWGATTWLPKLMSQAGFGLKASLTFLLVYTGGSIVGTLISSAIAERVGAKPMVILGGMLSGFGLSALAVTDALPVLLTTVGVAGFGIGTAQNLLQVHIAEFYPPDMRATALGWAGGAGRIGSIVGPAYGGYFVATAGGVSSAALAFAAPALLAALVMITVKPQLVPRSSLDPARTADLQHAAGRIAEEGAP
ncbi:MFS transporter [Streptomyces sp. 205]|uniref:MFS transporter n=2 Tax=Streptomyces coffeae TaxID=621382 RepID=A0ABS1NN23_9ACTN|nr:MFS transporter [Streptomyces coffeae]